jgi:putative protease
LSEHTMKNPIGKITNYYAKISVAVVELLAPLKKGEEIAIKGTTTDFTQTVTSMQIDRKDIAAAQTGQAIGLKVKDRVRPGDLLYRI